MQYSCRGVYPNEWMNHNLRWVHARNQLCARRHPEKADCRIILSKAHEGKRRDERELFRLRINELGTCLTGCFVRCVRFYEGTESPHEVLRIQGLADRGESLPTKTHLKNPNQSGCANAQLTEEELGVRTSVPDFRPVPIGVKKLRRLLESQNVDLKRSLAAW